MELEDYFKTPSQDEIDRQWLTQLCYDGQMADDEIEEHVNAVIDWKEKQVKNNVALHNVSQQRELLEAYTNKLNESRLINYRVYKDEIDDFLASNCG